MISKQQKLFCLSILHFVSNLHLLSLVFFLGQHVIIQQHRQILKVLYELTPFSQSEK